MTETSPASIRRSRRASLGGNIGKGLSTEAGRQGKAGGWVGKHVSHPVPSPWNHLLPVYEATPRQTFATLAFKVILRNSAMQRGIMSVARVRGLGLWLAPLRIPKDVKRLNSCWKTFFEWLSTPSKWNPSLNTNVVLSTLRWNFFFNRFIIQFSRANFVISI